MHQGEIAVLFVSGRVGHKSVNIFTAMDCKDNICVVEKYSLGIVTYFNCEVPSKLNVLRLR